MTTPWAEMLRQAAGRGLSPEAFWRLSLREWRMLAGPAVVPQPMNRNDLDRLAEAWPDG